MKYHLSWKLGLWDDNHGQLATDTTIAAFNHEKAFYSILNNLSRNETDFKKEEFSTSLLSSFANESIRAAKSKLVDVLKDTMVSEFNCLNKILGAIYRLDEIGNRQCLWQRKQVEKSDYELDMFDKTSFGFIDDLNCLRMQLVKMQPNDSNSIAESERLSYLDFLYECLIDNALNHKKFQVNGVYLNVL